MVASVVVAAVVAVAVAVVAAAAFVVVCGGPKQSNQVRSIGRCIQC